MNKGKEVRLAIGKSFPKQMIRKILLFSFVLLGAIPVFPQYATVRYDYEKNRFGENEPLPAERPLVITGSTPPKTELVEISIFKQDGRSDRAPLTTAIWKRPFDKTGNTYEVSVNYRLTSARKYDLLISYFRLCSEAERAEFFRQLTVNIDAYLAQTIAPREKGFDLKAGSRTLINDLNDIVAAGLKQYRIRSGQSFEGFSDLVRQQIEGLDKVKLSKTVTEGQLPAREAYRDTLLAELKTLIHAEVRFLLNNDIVVLTDSRLVDDYETEKRTDSYFSVNFGYGGVYLSGKLQEASSFGDAPYLGVGFPLATSTIVPKFFRNASVNLGFFLRDFTNEAGEEISGPIFNRPLYAGLDYKLFAFIRVNAGAAFLEKTNLPAGANSGDNSDFFVRPFLGLSAKVNVSLSLDK